MTCRPPGSSADADQPVVRIAAIAHGEIGGAGARDALARPGALDHESADGKGRHVAVAAVVVHLLALR
jgi:hypothetical protein